GRSRAHRRSAGQRGLRRAYVGRPLRRLAGERLRAARPGRERRRRRHRTDIADRRAARAAGRLTSDLTAYDLYLRGYAMAMSSKARVPEALRLMERAIARDPRYGPALSWAAFCCFRLLFDDRSEDPVADRLKGTDFARRALEAAGDDPDIMVEAAVALAHFGEDIGAMMALVDRALALNPNFARGWHASGFLRMYAGEPEIAIER